MIKEDRAEIVRKLAAQGDELIPDRTGDRDQSRERVLLHAPGEIQESGGPAGLQKP